MKILKRSTRFFSKLSTILNIEYSETNNLANKHNLNALNQNQKEIIIENSITIFLENLAKKLNLNKLIPKFLKRKLKCFYLQKYQLQNMIKLNLDLLLKTTIKFNTNFKKQTGVKFLV